MGVAIKITNFLGETPRLAERLLPDTAAQAAENVNLTSGEIRPVKPVLTVYTPSDPTNSHLSAYQATYNGASKWRTWTIDVDVAKGPLSYSVEARYYWTGDSCPRYATYTDFGTTDYALGLPGPTGTLTVTQTGGVSTTTANRIYVYTFYNPNTGEESDINTVSASVSGKIDATWTISGFVATITNDRAVPYNTTGLMQRLYRSAGTKADMQLVGQRVASTANWTDTLLDSQIMGDGLISTGWLPPPVGLTGITALPNGSLVGFTGNLICYSEPYQPHAWPLANQYGADYPVVGLASYGTTVVAATAAYPYIADGVDPTTVTLQRVDNAWPCLSKRSVCSVGDGVVFATTMGLAYVGMSGPSMFTKDLFTRVEWEPLNPSTMVTAMAEGRIFISYTPTSGQPEVLLIHPGEHALLTRYTLTPKELYADPIDGHLYLVDKTVDKWDYGTGTSMLYNWLSKEIELLEPLNFGAAKIDYVSTMSAADQAAATAKYQAAITYNAGVISTKKGMGAYNSREYNKQAINGSDCVVPPTGNDTLSFTLYIDGAEVFTRNIVGTSAFRLPSGFKRDFFSMRLSGNVRVKSVKLAQTMEGLKQI